MIGQWKEKVGLEVLEKEREEGKRKTRGRMEGEDDGGRRGGRWSRRFHFMGLEGAE